ncbi:MAG: PAS domain S-box protein [Bacteroidales bacterium]|nr:PAS domain S-box protein [Bacteroidales bacterium]
MDLKESEELFRTIIEQAGDAMYLSDFDGNILEVNSRAIEEMGYNLDEFLKLNVTNLDREYVDPKKAREF